MNAGGTRPLGAGADSAQCRIWLRCGELAKLQDAQEQLTGEDVGDLTDQGTAAFDVAKGGLRGTGRHKPRSCSILNDVPQLSAEKTSLGLVRSEKTGVPYRALTLAARIAVGFRPKNVVQADSKIPDTKLRKETVPKAWNPWPW